MKTFTMTMSLEYAKNWFVLFSLAFLTAIILSSCTDEERVVQAVIHPVYYEQVQMTEQDNSGIYVPGHAVCEDYKGRYVYLIELTEPGFGIAHRKSVQIGELSLKGLEVLSGIAEGDLVIADGIYYIKDGDTVRLVLRSDK